MNREEISNKLSLISPCLGKQDFMEILTHFCIKDGYVTSFNGVQAANVSLDLDVEGTVPGTLLQKLINSYSAEDIDLEQKDEKLIVSCGKSKANLNVLPSEDYVFSLEDVADSRFALTVDSDFVNGISKCLVSVSDNFIEKSQSGVTLEAYSKGVFLYSTDDVCLSKYTTTQKHKKNDKVILPKLFCVQLVNWHNALGDGTLHIGPDYVKAVFSEGNATLFSKVETEVEFLDFEDVIAQSYFEDTAVVPVPDKLKEIVQRCQLITSEVQDQIVSIDIGRNSINLLAESKNSVHNITDKVRVRGIRGDYSFKMDCNLLGRGLEYIDTMTFSADNPAGIDTVFFIGKSDNFLHLINSK